MSFKLHYQSFEWFQYDEEYHLCIVHVRTSNLNVVNCENENIDFHISVMVTNHFQEQLFTVPSVF